MPVPVIYTDHLVLRPWDNQDADVLLSLCADADMRRKLTALLASSLDATASAEAPAVWAIHSHSGAPLLGFCGFRALQANGDVELLYGFLPQLLQDGLALQACLAALSYVWGTRGVRRICTIASPSDRRSSEMMESLGMRPAAAWEGNGNSQVLLTYVIERPKHLLR